MDVGLEGSFGFAERLGDLGVREAVDVAEDDGDPLGRRQVARRLAHASRTSRRATGSAAGSAPGSKPSSVVGTRRTRARLRQTLTRIVVSQPGA